MISVTADQRTAEEMLDSIANEKTLIELLKTHKIADVDAINKINRYEKGTERVGIIVDIQEKGSNGRSKVLIDLKQGQPIINQVYDAIYSIGSHCAKRIILYSDGKNENDEDIPTADYWVVNSLINRLLKYPLGLSFLEMKEESFSIGPHPMHEFSQPNPELPITKAPTAEQFMAGVFWEVYFDSFNYTFYYANDTFRGDFIDTRDWGHVIYIDCSFYGEIQIYWDQKGLRYLVKQISDSEDYLKMVLAHEMPFLKKTIRSRFRPV